MKLFGRKLIKRFTNVFLALFLAAWQLTTPAVVFAHHNPGHNPGGGEATCPDDNGWTKINGNTGSASGAWGSIQWGDFDNFESTKDDLEYDVNNGYSLDICVKSGEDAFEWYLNNNECEGDAEGEKTRCWFGKTGDDELSGIKKDISHIAYRVHDNRTTIEVKKVLNPANDPGLFNLKINGVTKAANIGNGGTTGEVQIDEDDNLVVAETAGTNSSLNDYTTSIECRNQNGTLLGSGSSNNSSLRQMTLQSNKIHDGDNIVCEFINTRKTGTVKVVKDVVNDNGGTKTYADFTFKVNAGDTPRSFGPTTSPDGEKVVTLPAGTSFTVTEVEANTGGYASTYSGTCTGTVVEGQQQVCTITNDDIAPTLNLVKKLPNDNGGDAVISDFNAFIDGQLAQWGSNTVNAGSHTVSESTIFGYLPSGWSVDCGADGTITLLLGESKTCEITNDDVAPKLTLKKVVVNDNGGSAKAEDWTLTATPTVGSVLSGDGDDGFEDLDALSHTTYTLSESGPDGYAAGDWDCYSTAGVFSHPNGDTSEVRMSEGADVTCTITNNDKPPVIRVHKYVTYGSDINQAFDFEIDNDGNSSQYSVSDGGTITRGNLQAGHVTVTETVPAGWDQVYMDCYDDDWNGWSNGSTVEIGREYRCYVLNEQLGELTVAKDADPDDAQDFHFTIERLEEEECEALQVVALLDNVCGDSQWVSHDEFDLDDDNDASLLGYKSQYVRSGYYTITEGQVAGWNLDNINCGNTRVVNQTANSVTVYVGHGQSIDCVFTNKKQFVPKVLGKVTPKAAVTQFAVTGQSYDWRGSVMAVTLAGSALVTTVVRRKKTGE